MSDAPQPMSYLEALTLRLAHGFGRLDETLRTRHADYLLRSQNSDGGFSGREGGSDLYYTGFALRGLALTGVLEGEVASRAAEFLVTRLQGQIPIIDFLSLVYGGMLLETSAGIQIFEGRNAGWRSDVAQALERFRRPDGGYAKTDEGQSSSTYHTFLVVLCHQLMASASLQPERLIAFIKSRQRDDGGFVEIGPMKNSGTNPTAAAIGLLKILGACDEDTRLDCVDFLLEMPSEEGGFRANTRIPVADVLSTFTGLLTLADLGALPRVDRTSVRRYVASMQLESGGFHGGVWDDGTDVEYTFYGLGALALLTEE